MKYLLDTNICIHFFRGMFNLDLKFQEVPFSDCAISEITLAELVFGAESSNNTTKNLRIIENFLREISVLPIYNAVYCYGKEKARLRKEGLIISDFDLLIGCTAVEQLILVTENISELKRIRDIQIENWINR